MEELKNLPQEQNLNQNQIRDAKILLTEIQKNSENLKENELPILASNESTFFIIKVIY